MRDLKPTMPAIMMPRLAVATVLLIAELGLAAPRALAGSFQINPIRVDLGAAVASQALTVRNDGPDTLVVQMSVQAWTQENEQDVYRPTQDVLVTPPLAQIAPGAEQVIRVGLRSRPDPARQGTFRLFVNEVPGAPASGFTGLQVALRVSLPVFVAASGPARRDVPWTLSRDTDGGLSLAVENRGNVHVQLLDLTLFATGRDEPVARQSQLAYVLAGQKRTFAFPLEGPLPAGASSLRLSALTDGGSVDAVLPLVR
jgi:fimbrial chaperone protein